MRRRQSWSVFGAAIAGLQGAIRAAFSQASKPAGARVADLARQSEGRTFGRGECWDFAAAMLDAAGCRWERPFGFGQAVDWKREALLPGDILQFDSVKIHWRKDNRFGTIQLGFPQHTAIVLAARGTAVELAHQNYNRVRKVSRLTIDLSEIAAGQAAAYRPVAKAP